MRIKSRFFQICSFLYFDIDEKNLIFKLNDIYNIKNKIKSDTFKILIFI